MIANLNFPQIYTSKELFGFSQADWRNFPQILVKSNVRNLIYVILSSKDFDDRLDLFSHQNDEECRNPNELANDFNTGGNLNIQIFKNSTSSDRRYVDSPGQNIIAQNRYIHKLQCIAVFVAEPCDKYSICMSIDGLLNSTEDNYSYPYRLQLISSEPDVEYIPISSYNHEWNSFSTLFSFPSINDNEYENGLIITTTGDNSSKLIKLELIITLQATRDEELFGVLIIDELSHNILFNNNVLQWVNKGISPKYREKSISIICDNFSIVNGSGLIKVRLIRKTEDKSDNELFRIFGFSNLPIKIQNECIINTNTKTDEHERFELAANIPFYPFGYFDKDTQYLYPNKTSDENQYSGEYVRIDKSFLQKLYDKISYQSLKITEQASKIETLNTRVRPPFINEALTVIQNTIPDFLIRKQILLKLYNPTIEFIRDIFLELNKIFGFGNGLFTPKELGETMDQTMKLTFLKRLVMFICKLTAKNNYLTLLSDASEIVESRTSSQSVKACNTIIKVLCEEGKKDNDETKLKTCVQSTFDEFTPRGGGFKAILSLIK